MTSERKNIVQPKEWWEAADTQAKKEKKSLSEWIGDLILGALPERTRAKLPQRPSEGRPKKDGDK